MYLRINKDYTAVVIEFNDEGKVVVRQLDTYRGGPGWLAPDQLLEVTGEVKLVAEQPQVAFFEYKGVWGAVPARQTLDGVINKLKTPFEKAKASMDSNQCNPYQPGWLYAGFENDDPEVYIDAVIEGLIRSVRGE